MALPAGATFAQTPPGRYRTGFVSYREHPDDAEFVFDAEGTWVRLDDLGGDLDVTGRLVGGCVETLANLAGTRYLDPRPLAALGDGLIVYVEAAGDDSPTICRNLHGMRLAGVFDDATAIVVGRTGAPSIPSLSQHEAVVDALGMLDVPILADVERGHLAPYLPLVNGALARIEHAAATSRITQTLA